MNTLTLSWISIICVCISFLRLSCNMGSQVLTSSKARNRLAALKNGVMKRVIYTETIVTTTLQTHSLMPGLGPATSAGAICSAKDRVWLYLALCIKRWDANWGSQVIKQNCHLDTEKAGKFYQSCWLFLVLFELVLSTVMSTLSSSNWTLHGLLQAYLAAWSRRNIYWMWCRDEGTSHQFYRGGQFDQSHPAPQLFHILPMGTVSLFTIAISLALDCHKFKR